MILRPRYAPLLNGAILVTLFIPSVVPLVPLYLTIVHPPVVGTSLLNTYWAVWLPAGRTFLLGQEARTRTGGRRARPQRES